MIRSRTLALVGAAALLLVSAAPAVAQDDAAMDAMTVEVGGVEYAYTGLPTSLPSGTELTFRNDGIELHELVLVRIADGVTESFEELLAMEAEGRDPMAEGLVEMAGPLIAGPGEVAAGSLPLELEGNYVAICFIPQGVIPEELAALGIEDMGPDMDMSALSPEAQEYMAALEANPPHFALGMVQEFAVTPEGTEAGPMPAEAEDEMAEAEKEVVEEMSEAEEEVAEAREEIEEEKEEAKEQATD